MGLGTQINNFLRYFGFELTRIKGRSWYVGDAALKVNTLIDVGTAFGTPEFYSLNKQAALLLIDPLKEYEPYMRKILANRKGSYEIVALASGTGVVNLNVHKDSLTKTTALEHTELTRRPGKVEHRKVNTKKLDDIICSNKAIPPYGLKIDTEGFELEVIKGAEKTLEKTDFIIAEVSVFKRFEESYTFLELINEMHDRGFQVFNILGANPDSEGRVRYMDVLFVRKNQNG